VSKYHKRVGAIANWTTLEGIAAGLRAELALEGYGAEFQAWLDGVPVDEETIRQAIIDEVISPPIIEKYQQSLRAMAADGFLNNYAVFAKADPELIFEHGDFRRPMILDGFEVVTGAKDVERRRKRTTKTDVKKEDRARKLQEKLDDTLNTDEDDYLRHAIQCGYLMKNTTIRFFAQIEGQYGTSTETQIRGITLPKLQEFIDSAGRPSLSGVSTHVDTSREKAAEACGGRKAKADVVEAVHSGFVEEILDFLNLEYVVDVGGIKRQHREEKADSQFRSIGHWIEQSGGDSGMVLEKLKERRRNLDPDEITAAFELGYETTEM